jgi:hypothetical protein
VPFADGTRLVTLAEVTPDAPNARVIDYTFVQELGRRNHSSFGGRIWRGGLSAERLTYAKSQAFVIDFQCLSRSAINSARCRSSPSSRMRMSAGLARR